MKLWLLEQDILQTQGSTKISTGDNLSCKSCGRTVNVKEAGKGPLVCCGQPMEVMSLISEE
jgi:desulfoferrodoxin-like iron-binding protein